MHCKKKFYIAESFISKFYKNYKKFYKNYKKLYKQSYKLRENICKPCQRTNFPGRERAPSNKKKRSITL